MNRNPFNAAFHGYVWFFKSQWNAKIHISFTLLVFGAGIFFGISRFEWLAILLTTGLVWIAELLNTSIEFLLDKLHPQIDHQIGRAKDIAAAAVLSASILSVICGLIIFTPYLVQLLNIKQ